MTSKFDADDPSSEDRGQSLAFEDDDDEVDVDDLSVEFVKEWVMKSPKILLIFADIPQLDLCFVQPIFRFGFLVTFGSEITKIRKYYVIFVYILQGKMGKMEKTERKSLKWPKHQKPKDGNMEWTKHKWKSSNFKQELFPFLEFDNSRAVLTSAPQILSTGIYMK